MLHIWTTTLFCALALVIPVSRGADHQVTVGGVGILKYDPDFVTADPGDTVTFLFKQVNHTVTQSTLDTPCVPKPGGFDSGFVPVPASQTSNFTVAQFTVADTDPVWVFCRQANHCEQGMVFAINPGNDLATFQSNAVGNSTTSSSTASVSVVTVTATVTVDGSAQTTTYTTGAAAAAPTSTSSSANSTSTTNHVVTVGQNGTLTFSPNNFTASPGDTVTFRYLTKNHTATQSSFADPCTPLGETSSNGLSGFDSGFMPVAADDSDFPEFNITVNDTAPIWVYCKQTNPASHCHQGMVLAINAPQTGNTFSAFLANAEGSAASASAAPSSTQAPAVSGTLITASGTPTAAPVNPSSGNGGVVSVYRVPGVLIVAFAMFLGALL